MLVKCVRLFEGTRSMLMELLMFVVGVVVGWVWYRPIAKVIDQLDKIRITKP